MAQNQIVLGIPEVLFGVASILVMAKDLRGVHLIRRDDAHHDVIAELVAALEASGLGMRPSDLLRLSSDNGARDVRTLRSESL